MEKIGAISGVKSDEHRKRKAQPQPPTLAYMQIGNFLNGSEKPPETASAVIA
jgi:hypothetical protein